jgi:hypothetical protein
MWKVETVSECFPPVEGLSSGKWLDKTYAPYTEVITPYQACGLSGGSKGSAENTLHLEMDPLTPHPDNLKRFQSCQSAPSLLVSVHLWPC